MDKKTLLAAGVVVVVVAVVAVFAFRRPDNNANFPEGTEWLCTNKACGNHFRMTVKELGEYTRANYGKPILCPKCNQPAAGARTCSHCKKVHVQVRGMNVCPLCGKPPPPPKD
jgi:hypothetical protein